MEKNLKENLQNILIETSKNIDNINNEFRMSEEFQNSHYKIDEEIIKCLENISKATDNTDLYKILYIHYNKLPKWYE